MIDGTLSGLVRAMIYSVQNPRPAARAMLGLHLPVAARWLGLALAAAGSTLLTVLAVRLSPAGDDLAVQQILANPLFLAAVQVGVLLVVTWLMAQVGRLAGGQGGFADAMVLMVWLQVILMAVQIVQLAVQLVSPMAGEVLGLLALGLLFWLLTNFVAELHGFTALGAVFAGIIGTALVLSFAVAVLLVSLVGG